MASHICKRVTAYMQAMRGIYESRIKEILSKKDKFIAIFQNKFVGATPQPPPKTKDSSGGESPGPCSRRRACRCAEPLTGSAWLRRPGRHPGAPVRSRLMDQLDRSRDLRDNPLSSPDTIPRHCRACHTSPRNWMKGLQQG